jgi:DNA-binding transcriptional regulator YiaG
MKPTIKSPMTGNDMVLCREPRKIPFRKEEFEIMYHFYRDTDGTQYTETFTDEVNINQVYNQYRDKYNLPFPDEIKAVREQYELSAAKMSEVLGFGANVWRSYGAGEVPSESNARLIQLVQEPKRMRDLVELNEHLAEKEKKRILHDIDAMLAKPKPLFSDANIQDYLMGGRLPDKTTGYRRPNLARMTEMIVFFTEKKKPFKTVMNKLLFYADFLHFKRTCYSISGARYRAIQMGPVPVRFDALFDHVATKDDVDLMQTELADGKIGAQFEPHKDRPFHKDLFSADELKTLEDVAQHFAKCTSKQMIDLSHEEEAWKEKQEAHEVMDYTKAFELKAI